MSAIARRIIVNETENSFSLAIIADTQREVKSATDTRFGNRTQWLVDNKDELRLRYVLQVGDLTDWGDDDENHYIRASNALSTLEDANICYALCPGNHDTRAVAAGGSARDPSRTRELVRETPGWLKYFPASRFPMLRGAFEAGKSDNCYHTFQAGGKKWLILALEFMPRYTAVDWAKGVVENHPDYNIILLTHMFLEGNGSIGQSGEYGESSPQYMYDNLVKVYPNFRFVFGGHAPTWSHREMTGVNGNKIYAYNDCWHHPDSNPTRIVTFDMKAQKYDTYVYMPSQLRVESGTSTVKTNVSWVG